EQLEEYLEKEKCRVTAHIHDDVMRIDYDYFIQDGPYKPSYWQAASPQEKDCYLIYIYGPSFLASKPPFFKGDFPFFPGALEKKLSGIWGENFKVINFGMEGLDSFDIKEIIKATVEARAPDLAIYYDLSASDFECAYFANIKCNFDLARNSLRSLGRLFIFKRPPKIGNLNKFTDWFLRESVEPRLINFAQKMGLITIPEEPFLGYNMLIFNHYKENLHTAISFLRKKNIPFVIMTSLSNLEARPYGIHNITDKYYFQGMKERDYLKRINYLTLAKDSEIFSGELVSKSFVYAFLKNLNERGVYVFDLYKLLEDKGFEFNYKNFYDYGHMNPYSHDLIAEYLAEFLSQNEDISSGFKR
ncbi:MAG: hypothetical protein AB1481_05625, partial [Candidatus Omnitrophota bacterium]